MKFHLSFGLLDTLQFFSNNVILFLCLLLLFNNFLCFFIQFCLLQGLDNSCANITIGIGDSFDNIKDSKKAHIIENSAKSIGHVCGIFN